MFRTAIIVSATRVIGGERNFLRGLETLDSRCILYASLSKVKKKIRIDCMFSHSLSHKTHTNELFLIGCHINFSFPLPAHEVKMTRKKVAVFL
jgi:hypothetical protein